MPGDKPKFRPVWVTVREYLKEKHAKENIEMTTNSKETTKEEAEESQEEVEKPSRFRPFKLLLKSVFSLRFLVLFMYAVSCGFAISYGLGTMEYQYADLTTKHEFYDQMFSIVSSLGIVVIPLWSVVIDKLGLHAYCMILVVLAITFYGVLLIRSLPVHIADFFIFSVVRVSVGTGISNFNVRFFDPTLFGSMTGIIWFVNICFFLFFGANTPPPPLCQQQKNYVTHIYYIFFPCSLLLSSPKFKTRLSTLF